MVPVSARLATKPARLFSVPRALLLSALLFAAWPSMVEAQYFPQDSIPDTFDDQTTSGVVLLGRPDGLFGPYADTGYFGPYLSLQHTAGDGPGYRDNGYTTLGLFAPRKAFSGILFSEGRLSVDDFGELIGNVGGGYRYYAANQNRIYGISAWYDVDAGHNSTFSQGGLSLETRGQNWDFFLNGYFPIDDDPKQFNRIVTPTGNVTFGFAGVNLAFNNPNLVTRQSEVAMTGFDAELGGPLPIVGKYGIRGYGGYYHYENDNVSDVNGGRMRLLADLTDSLSGQFMLTNDNQFDTSVIFNIAWTLPGSGASRGEWNRPVNRSGRTVVRAQSPSRDTIRQYYRMFQPTQRNSRTFVTRFNTRTLEDNFSVLTDPNTGQPIVIFHMDSRAAAGGDGSFEMPFANPQEAQAGTGNGAIIFTHAGSVFDNPANNFIALQANQQLLGEGPTYTINTGELGAIPIPPSGDVGGLPIIQGGGGVAAVTLANGSRLSGFDINDSVAAGILADANLTAGNSALVENTSINGGPIGLNVMNAAGTVNFADTSTIANTTVAGLNVTGAGTTGTVNVAGTITNDAGRSFFIDNLQPGGVVNITGQVTATGGTGSVVQNSAGNVNVARLNFTNIDAGSTGLTLIDNPDATIALGTVNIMTNNGPAFVARNSGRVSSATGNLIANGGPAIFLDDNGSALPFMANLRFNDVTSNTSAVMSSSGIHVEDVSGFLAIAGTADINTPMGRGIEIIDSSADVSIATLNVTGSTGNAVFLQDNSGGGADLLTGTFTVNGGLIEQTVDGSDTFVIDGGSSNVNFGANINHGVGVVNDNAMVSIMDTNIGTTNFTGTLVANDGTGIQFSNADNTVNFMGTTTLNGGDAGVDIIMGSTGGFTFSDMTTITNPTGIGFNIDNSAPTVVYDGTIAQNLGAEAVRIDTMGAGGIAFFNDEVNASAASLGVVITDSAGSALFANYINQPALTASTSLTLNNNTGTYQFDLLDIRTTGDGNLGIDANNGGTLFVGAGSVQTDGETAISIRNGTQLGTVNFNSVTATNTVGGGAFDGVFLSDVPVGGIFSIDNGITGDSADLTVTGTAGGDGFRAVNFESEVFVAGANIDTTGGGDGIDLNGGTGTFTFGTLDIGDAGAGGLGGGAGIRIADTDGMQTFLRTNIENTEDGHGVVISGLGMNNMLLFDDGDSLTTADLRIDDTGGAAGDGINISDTMDGSVIAFSSVNITNTGAGHGVEIGNGGVAGMGVDGDIFFSDGDPTTTNDLRIMGTGGGDGIRIIETLANADLTFSSVDIDATGGGDGINISTMADGDILFSDMLPGTAPDVQITNTGGGDAIEVTGVADSLDLTFSSVDIDDTATGHGVNINNTGGTIVFNDGDPTTPMPNLFDLDINNTGGGDGIHIENSLAGLDLSFSTVDISDTATGNGVTILGNGMTAIGMVAFGDGDFLTDNDLNITNTGGGDGIDIANTGAAGTFTFSSVDIDGTATGIGLDIDNAAGTITFNDMTGTDTDLTITNTGGGDGIEISNSSATFTFSGIDVSNTGTGNGVELIDNMVAINIADGDIRNADGVAFRVDGGEENVTYSGDITDNNEGLLVEVVNRFGGLTTVTDFNGDLQSTGAGGGIRIAGATDANTVRFDGMVNLGLTNADVVTGATRLSGMGDAVDIDNNTTGSQITFADLDIVTDGRDGLNARNGGTLTITTSRFNTIDATAIELNDIAMGITLAGVGPVGGTQTSGPLIVNGASGNDALSFTDVTGTFTVTGQTTITDTSSAFDNGIFIDGGTAAYVFNPNVAQTTTIDGSTGDAISMANTTGGSLTIGRLAVSNSADGGVALADNVGTVNITGGSISSTTGTAFEVIGGGAAVTYGGTINNTSGLAVDVQDRTGGTIAFNGAITSVGANAQGINVSGATAGNTVNFTADVDLGSVGTPITMGTAGVNVDGNTQAQAVNFSNLDIFTNGVTGLQASNGANLGITTGTVTTTGATGINFDGSVTAVNANNISLASVSVTNSGAGNDALSFNNVTGTFGVTGTTTVDGAATLSGIDIDGGTAAFTFGTTNITATAVAGNAIDINGAGGAINFGNTTITNSAMSGISIANTTAAGDVTFAQTNVSGVTADAIVLTDNAGDFVTNGGTIAAAAGMDGISATYASTNGDISIIGTTIDGGVNGINVTATGTSAFQMLIDNNTIGQGTAPTANGVLIDNQGTMRLDVTLTRNLVDGGTDGLTAIQAAGGGTLALNIGTNNTNGTVTTNGLENDFNTYVLTNNGAGQANMLLGVAGNNITDGNTLNNAAEVQTELDDFGNLSNGGGTSATVANPLEAENPTSILVP